MPTQSPTEDRQTISMPCEGAMLKAIRDLASADHLPLGRAAVALMAKGIAATAMLRELDPEEEVAPAIVDLSVVPVAWLSDEVVRRLAAAAQATTQVQLARDEADEATRRLARISAIMMGAD